MPHYRTLEVGSRIREKRYTIANIIDCTLGEENSTGPDLVLKKTASEEFLSHLCNPWSCTLVDPGYYDYCIYIQ
jgi:hypothetical protein